MKEKLQEYALIAEIISAIAVVVSLVFVGIQIRDSSESTDLNTAAILANSRQESVKMELGLIYKTIESPAIAKWNVEGFERLDPIEQEMVRAQIEAFFRARENLWFQYQAGVIDSAVWDSYYRLLLEQLRQRDIILTQWEVNPYRFDKDFVNFINENLKN